MDNYFGNNNKNKTPTSYYQDEEENNFTNYKKEYKGLTMTFNNDKKSDCLICNKNYSHSHSNINEQNNLMSSNIPSSNTITTDLRITNLERRLENTEKMMKFYEEMLRLKDEEKKNEFRIDQNKINDLLKKINILEDNLKILNKRINDQNEILNEKLEMIDKRLHKFNETKNSIGDFYSDKLAEIESLIKKNDIIIESVIDEKLQNFNSNIDNKLEEMLNLINDIGKSCEQNEFNILESKENIRIIQSDHLDFIKIVSILKEKADTLDYIMLQITELKQKYSKIVKIYGENSNEEDKFLNKIFNN